MTSISSYYSVYASPPPPPPPPPQVIGVDGEPKEVEVVVVIGQRNPADPYRSLLPYGGLSGAQQNSVRDQNFFFGEGLAGRAEAQGGSASAIIMVGEEDGDGAYTTLELGEVVVNTELIAQRLPSQGIEVASTSNIQLQGQGYTDVILSTNGMAHIIANHGLPVAGKSTFSSTLLDPVAFMTYVVKPLLASGSPAIQQGQNFVFEGTVQWAGNDSRGIVSDRVRLVLMPSLNGPAGALEILTAYPVQSRP